MRNLVERELRDTCGGVGGPTQLVVDFGPIQSTEAVQMHDNNTIFRYHFKDDVVADFWDNGWVEIYRD